jgi:predicted nucleic acid-binding Zn finger protein
MEKNNPQKDNSMPRLVRGISLCLQGRVKPNGKGYYVDGEQDTYFVSETFETCDCPDFKNNRKPCKHIYAARLQRRMELKEIDIRAEIESKYEHRINELERKLHQVAEENLKLSTQLEAFTLLKEGFKKLMEGL